MTKKEKIGELEKRIEYLESLVRELLAKPLHVVQMPPPVELTPLKDSPWMETGPPHKIMG